MKVFLGGTCNESTWREELIKNLKIDYYNPVVPDWTPECQKEEIHQREICDYCLYVITPKMTGVYSIAEVVDDSNKRPFKTILAIIKEDEEHKFNDSQWKSLLSTLELCRRNNSNVLIDPSMDNLADFINNLAAK